MKRIFLFVSAIAALTGFSQGNYVDSLKAFQKDYVQNHEVVKGKDRQQLQFFEIDSAYHVIATIEKKENSPWFQMPTSGPIKKLHRMYGVAHFAINGTAVQLNIYQSQDLLHTATYKNYLFLPFTDATTGKETYEGGRYIDLVVDDIKNNQVVIDFNKAYNPYCAYVSGLYNCPIPPAANTISIPVKAGEKAYKKD